VIAAAVARYAQRFHVLLADGHSVGSPLGAWLLLALVGPAATGAERERLTDVLGLDLDTAFTAARSLLSEPHPELAVGSAIWHDPAYETPALLEFVRRLVPPADAGPMPTQAEADGWARERTLGLIEKFPLEIDNDLGTLVLLLSTALATKVSWDEPFQVVPARAGELPATPGFAGRSLLRRFAEPLWQGFVHSPAGPLAAFAVRSRGGLVVASAIGSREPAVPLEAAQTLAMELAGGREPARIPLAELPLGDGPSWRVTEQVQYADEDERYECLLPAWEAEADHALIPRPELGFPAAGAAILRLLIPGDYEVEAKHSAVARYTAVGFEAAAVTALAARTASARVSPRTTVRTARVEFTQPHAVVAATAGGGEWAGLPVFAAWVTEAIAAD